MASKKSAGKGAGSGSKRNTQSNRKQTETRTKSSSIKIGGKQIYSHQKKYDGKTAGERIMDYKTEKLRLNSDPAVVAEKEKTKRALGYGGAVASSANSAAAAAKQTVILSEGGINPTTPEPEEPEKDQNQYSWGGS